MKALILALVSVLTLVLALYCDIEFIGEQPYVAFARSGSLLVVFGALFESKFVLRIGEQNKLYIGGELTIIESKFNKELTSSLIDKLATHAGFVVILLGTLIWGFGDLLYLVTPLEINAPSN